MNFQKMHKLSNEELVNLYQHSDSSFVKQKILDIIVRKNIRFVQKVAGQYSCIAEYDDLIQEGSLGLITAVEKYQPDKGCKFIGYAYYWIKQYFFRYIKTDNIIRLPDYLQELIYKYKLVVNDFEIQNSRTPTKEELMQIMDISEAVYNTLIEALSSSIVNSLDSNIKKDESDSLMIQLLPDPNNAIDKTTDEIQAEYYSAALSEVLSNLKINEYNILIMRFRDNKTRVEIAETIKASPQRVAEIEKGIIRKIKRALKPEDLQELKDDYYSGGLKNTSLTFFRNTGQSAVEKAAISKADAENKANNDLIKEIIR